jgi:uncharacterized RDD family membrane protein YckC
VKDLQTAPLMYLKAILFLILGATASVILIMRNPEPTTALLVLIAVWAFARAYYFAFYVLERYIDPSYRFAGLGSLLRYVIRITKNSKVDGL